MGENFKNICKNILNIANDKTKNLNNKTRILLDASILIFIISKILSLFKINIPGAETLSMTLLYIIATIELFKKYKTTKKLGYLIGGSIFLGISLILTGCFVIIYPFIIASTILL